MTPGWVLKGILLCFWAVHSGTAAIPVTWHVRTPPSSNQLNGVTYGSGLFVAAGSQGIILISSNGTDWMARSAGTVSTFFCADAAWSGFYLAGEGVFTFWREGADAFNRLSTNGTEEMYAIVSRYQFLGVGRDRLAGKSYVLYEGKTNGVPTTNTLFAISWRKAQGGEIIVSTPLIAVGDHGTIIRSTNGMDWTLEDAGTTVPLRAAIHHQGRIIVGGDDGVLLTSIDGISWTSLPRVSFDIRALASSGIAVVAVGQKAGSGRLQVSADGVNWPGMAIEFAKPLNAVTHGQSSFMAVGDGGMIVQSGYAPDLSVNAWTKSTSGLWEEPFWSCDRLPAADQGWVALTNAGSKLLEINHNTTANFPNALAIRGLMIEGTADSFNHLLLNNAGTNVPLTAQQWLVVGTNASLTSYSSALSAYEADLSSATLFAENSRVNIGRIRLSSELTISNSYASVSLLLVRPDKTVQQFGGSNYLYRAGFNAGSSFTLSGGVLSIKELYLQSALPNWEGISTNGSATFIQNEGETSADVMKLGMWGLGSYSRRGELALQGGLLKCSSMEFFHGSVTQSAGTNITEAMMIPNHPDCAGGSYFLSGGTLVSGSVGLGRSGVGWPVTRASGHFVQSGGLHVSSGISLSGFLENAGRSLDKYFAAVGRYSLSGGLLKSDGMHVGGRFTQTRGTNHTLYLSVTGGGEYLLTDGELKTSRAHVSGVRLNAYNCWGSGGITQEGGAHTIENNLTIRDYGRYHLNAGTLTTSNISVGLRARLICSGGVLSNRGIITLRGGSLSAVGAHHPGKLELLEITDTTWPCMPATNSLILGATNRTELRFCDSSGVPWSGVNLWIMGWSADGGSQRLFLGTNAQGLTEAQLSKLVFVNPVGWRSGQYPARILKTGEIVPGVPPALAVTRDSASLVLSWPGEYDLLSATNIHGPFIEVTNATNPLTNLFDLPQQFFQLRLRKE